MGSLTKIMNLSDNPLKPRTKDFLKSDNPLDFNKSQYLTGLGTLLDNSIRYFHHILKFPLNLPNEVIDEKINAQTFHLFLERALVDFGKSWTANRYDFRTTELARLLFHISANYLQDSPTWKDEKFIKSDIQRFANYFRALSKSELDKNSHVTISEKREHEINMELEKFEKQIQFEKYDPKGKWFKNNKLYEKLREKRVDWNNTWALLKNQLDETKPGVELVALKEQVKIAKSLKDSIVEKFPEVQKERDEILEEIANKQSTLNEELSHKFDHLLAYYCPLDVLPAFNGKKNFHLNEDDDDHSHYSRIDFGDFF